MLWMIIIPGGFFAFVVFCAFLWFCWSVYHEHSLISHANTLLWRHPSHSPIDDEIADKKTDSELVTQSIEALHEYVEQAHTKREKKEFVNLQRRFSREWKHIDVEIRRLERRREYPRIPVLEFSDIKDPPGADWYYKPAPPVGWFMGEKKLKWCYEIETASNPGYTLEPYVPDKAVKADSITSSELAEGIEWGFAMDFFGTKTKLLKTLAMGGLILLGLASMVGIIYLSIFLQGGIQ